MKYISTMIFALALAYSWHLVHRDIPISSKVHTEIQQEWINGIRERIEKYKPTAKNVKILDIRSETIDSNNIKLIYAVGFDDIDPESNELVNQKMQSEAFVTRTNPSDPASTAWELNRLKINTVELNFNEGINVTPMAVPGDEEPKKLVPVPEAAAPDEKSESPDSAHTPVYE